MSKISDGHFLFWLLMSPFVNILIVDGLICEEQTETAKQNYLFRFVDVDCKKQLNLCFCCCCCGSVDFGLWFLCCVM